MLPYQHEISGGCVVSSSVTAKGKLKFLLGIFSFLGQEVGSVGKDLSSSLTASVLLPSTFMVERTGSYLCVCA